VDDSSALNVQQVQARAERMKVERGIDILVLDYLGLMRGSQKYSNRVAEVSEISAGLKSIAKTVRIPCGGLPTQPAPEDRRTREPGLHDLRDSGSLEQDADQVILIHRPDSRDGQLCAESELIVAKNRQGRTGRAKVLFHREWTRFVDAVVEE